jgi:hypothetical protein
MPVVICQLSQCPAGPASLPKINTEAPADHCPGRLGPWRGFQGFLLTVPSPAIFFSFAPIPMCLPFVPCLFSATLPATGNFFFYLIDEEVGLRKTPIKSG